MKMSEIFEGILNGSLVPRFHAGVGMMQLYLTESVRLHVFHPDLPAHLEAFGNRHNHRFDMTSHVLMGTIVDIPLKVEPSFFVGNFELYLVTPAHLYTGTEKPQRLDDNYYDIKLGKITRVARGQSYTMGRGEYHETRSEGLTVTLVTKSDQHGDFACIVAHRGQSIAHAMADSPPLHVLKQLVFSSLRKLSPEAKDFIEKSTGE